MDRSKIGSYVVDELLSSPIIGDCVTQTIVKILRDTHDAVSYEQVAADIIALKQDFDVKGAPQIGVYPIAEWRGNHCNPPDFVMPLLLARYTREEWVTLRYTKKEIHPRIRHIAAALYPLKQAAITLDDGHGFFHTLAFREGVCYDIKNTSHKKFDSISVRKSDEMITTDLLELLMDSLLQRLAVLIDTPSKGTHHD